MKQCASCGTTLEFTPDNFPRKGRGRLGNRCRPCERTLRQQMLKAGCAIRYGRRVVTTHERIDKFFEQLEKAGQTSQPGQPSSPPPEMDKPHRNARSTASAPRSTSGADRLPMSDVDMALRTIARLRERKKRQARSAHRNKGS